MNLTLKVEVDPGTDIEYALVEACMLASHIKCSINFNFNGVEICVLPNYKVDIDKRIKDGEIKYHKVLKENYKFMVI